MRAGLAAWLVALLALAPVAQPPLPAAAAAPAGAPQAVVSHDAGSRETGAPAARARPTQRLGQGILTRYLLTEAALGPPPTKPPLLRLTAARGATVAVDPTVPTADIASKVFHRSSVGSARTPTGPPS